MQSLVAAEAAATQLVQAGGRGFLESRRFDRVGAWGRRPLVADNDMLPMAFTPLPGGDVPELQWDFEWPLPAERGTWQAAADAALLFWADATRDERISPGFRARAADLGQRLSLVRDRA